jgi:hypothetical protein
MASVSIRRVVSLKAVLLGSVFCAATGMTAVGDREKVDLAMRVTPSIAFSPARVSAIAELRGEPTPDRHEALYCVAVEWDWGDGTRSEAETDCEPYEAGKSEIQRRYSAQHTYNQAGRYRILLRLKRNNKTVLATNSSIQIRPGAREWGN